MRESVFARLWNLIKPPPAVKRRELQPRQKRLLIAAAAFLALAGAGWAAYSYISGAPDRAQAEFQAGMKYMQPGQYQNAIFRFTKAIRIHEFANVYLERGNAHRFLGEADQAAADFEKAADLDPTLARAYTALGAIYRDRGDRTRALEQYSKSIAISPNVDALFERGELYESVGEHQKAVDDFTRAIDRIPLAPYIYVARATARRNLGDIAGYQADRDQAQAIERPDR